MIRSMRMEDISTIQQIAHVTWKSTYDGLIPQNIQTSFLNKAYSQFMMIERMNRTCMLVAESEGEPVGFLNMTYDDEDGDCELTALYILPSFQQTGIGKSLFSHAIQLLSTSAKQLFVYVDGRNHNARMFYEKQGFELISVFDELFEGCPVQTAQYVYYVNSPISLTK